MPIWNSLKIRATKTLKLKNKSSKSKRNKSKTIGRDKRSFIIEKVAFLTQNKKTKTVYFYSLCDFLFIKYRYIFESNSTFMVIVIICESHIVVIVRTITNNI